ncbi:hypothetical protein, partial [Streptobacillus ratti]|uniref:hypothetical protein n=1 Tax=Streptobacillus ratti TaxID=1720557 RepID=UPI0039ECCF03
VNGGGSSPAPAANTSNEMKIKELWDQKDVTNEIGAKGDLGVFMHKNKEVFAFIGTDLKATKKESENMKFNDKTPYHFGLRWDADIVDSFNIQLTAAHRRGGENIAWEEKLKIDKNDNEKEKVHKHNGIKHAIEKHLASKGKKGKAGTDQGYKLGEEHTFLLSAVLNGKIYNNFSLTVAGLYNSADFKDNKHELETYVKTNGQLTDNVKIANAEIKHVLSSESYSSLGKLSGDIKVETQASERIKLSNEAKFELKNILKDNNKRESKVELLNNGVYSANSFELRGDVNYKLEIKEENDTTLKHEPEVKLGATFKPTSKLSLITDNSNKVTIGHKVGTAGTTELKNDFTTSNKIKVNATDGIDIHTLAEYKLGTDFKNTNGKEHSHALLTGAGIKVKKEIEEVSIESTIDGRYLFDTKHKQGEKAQDLRHQGFVWTENKVGYEINDNNKIEGKVNLYNQIHLHTNPNKLDNDKDFYNVFLANVLLNYTNVNGRYTNEINVDAKYGLDKIFKQGTPEIVNSEGTYQALSIDFGGKSRFKARENVEIELSLDNEYNLNGLNKDVYGVYVDYIKDASGYKESIHKYAEKYGISKQDDLRKEKGKIKDLTKGKLATKDDLAKAIHS